jgi:hypothetical protein
MHSGKLKNDIDELAEAIWFWELREQQSTTFDASKTTELLEK